MRIRYENSLKSDRGSVDPLVIWFVEGRWPNGTLLYASNLPSLALIQKVILQTKRVVASNEIIFEIIWGFF